MLQAELSYADEVVADQGEYGWITTGHIKGTWLYGNHLAIRRGGVGEYVEYYNMDVDLPVVSGVSGTFVSDLSQGASYITQQVFQSGEAYFVNCPYVYYSPSYASVSATERTYHLHYLGNNGNA